MTTEIQLDLSYAKREAAWLEFDAKNPQVYRRFCALAFELIDQGHRHFSARMLWESMRLETLRVQRVGEYVLNDHNLKFIVAKFQAEHPTHAKVFETRDHKPRLSRRATG